MPATAFRIAGSAEPMPLADAVKVDGDLEATGRSSPLRSPAGPGGGMRYGTAACSTKAVQHQALRPDRTWHSQQQMETTQRFVCGACMDELIVRYGGSARRG